MADKGLTDGVAGSRSSLCQTKLGRRTTAGASENGSSAVSAGSSTAGVPMESQLHGGDDGMTGAGTLLRQLQEVCTDWESDTHSLALHIVHKVPLERRHLYEQWIQDFIVTQSQGWEGYQGTLMYRPSEHDSSPNQPKSDHLVYMLDVRYRGANNMKRWLASEVRAAHIAKGIRQRLWETNGSYARVLEGRALTVDYVWSDDPTVSGGAWGQPEVAVWRLLIFTILCVWIVVLALLWPVGSLGDATRNWPWQASLLMSEVVAVPLVIWVVMPTLQPLLTWWLVQTRPSHWLWHTEPLVTLYEGFSCLRPPKNCPSNDQVNWNPIGGSTEEVEMGSRQPRSSEDVASMMLQSVEMENEHIRLAAKESCERQAREAAKSSPLVKLDGPLSIIVNHYVHPQKFAEFEAVLRDLGTAVTSFSCDEFVGSTIIRPKPGSNLYTAILRFESRSALEKWLECEERKHLVAQLHALTMSPIAVRAYTHGVLELLMSGRRSPTEEQDDVGSTTGGGPADAKHPPPKFKTAVIILVSLYTSTLTTGYALNNTLAGLPLPWNTLVAVSLNAVIISYTLVPWTSRLSASWLDASRPDWYQRAMSGKHHLAVSLARWLYDGFSTAELMFIDGVVFGLLVGLALSGKLVFPYP